MWTRRCEVARAPPGHRASQRSDRSTLQRAIVGAGATRLGLPQARPAARSAAASLDGSNACRARWPTRRHRAGRSRGDADDSFVVLEPPASAETQAEVESAIACRRRRADGSNDLQAKMAGTHPRHRARTCTASRTSTIVGAGGDVPMGDADEAPRQSRGEPWYANPCGHARQCTVVWKRVRLKRGGTSNLPTWRRSSVRRSVFLHWSTRRRISGALAGDR